MPTKEVIMTIDNFDIISKHIDFNVDTDRYVVHILRRAKDCTNLQNTLGSNEVQRLIRTYYVDNLEYLKNKMPAIKELCKTTNSRAYIIVSPKDMQDCLLMLGEKVMQIIRNKNYNIKPDHLVRQAFCENHRSRRKTWIVDLDNDEMYGWKYDDVLAIIKKYVAETGRDINEIYSVPTRNGCHIITPPFNLQKAYEECPMLYEGQKQNKPGWLHKDGMTLLYYTNE
jgi:hypothetical protein